MVAGALIEGPDGLLLVQNQRRNGSLDWTPPGGVIEIHEGETVLDGLARTSDDASFPMAAVALRLAFRAPSAPLPPYADLTAVQRRTVQVIAELPESSWRWGNLMEILQEWDLPTDRDECRAYAGLA